MRDDEREVGWTGGESQSGNTKTGKKITRPYFFPVPWGRVLEKNKDVLIFSSTLTCPWGDQYQETHREKAGSMYGLAIEIGCAVPGNGG